MIAGAAAAAGLGNATGGDDIDRLIRMAEAGIRVPPPGVHPGGSGPVLAGEDVAGGAADADEDDAAGGGTGKKKKDKSGRMVYADGDVSPEERLAEMARYRWIEV